jgi:hypothetical protein
MIKYDLSFFLPKFYILQSIKKPQEIRYFLVSHKNLTNSFKNWIFIAVDLLFLKSQHTRFHSSKVHTTLTVCSRSRFKNEWSTLYRSTFDRSTLGYVTLSLFVKQSELCFSNIWGNLQEYCYFLKWMHAFKQRQSDISNQRYLTVTKNDQECQVTMHAHHYRFIKIALLTM